MSVNKFSKISSIIKDAKKGKMFILVDDKNRENEGDLIIPGSKCNSKNINFMAKHGRGLICLALTKKQIDRLKLPLMSHINRSRMQTAFTVSIEAKKGISTGISAFDRAKTIKTAINKKSTKKDIVSPGHVFPLVARSGGVLERAGHTEASVDISKLSKLNPSAVICEVMNQDGRMARLKDLRNEFTHCFRDADTIILCPIFTAGEKINLGFHYNDFAKEIIKNSKVKLFMIRNNIELAKFLKQNIYGNKIVIGMGAGTISNWMKKLPELM